MVRSTPTGISAIIDAFGRVVPGQRLGEGAFGVIDAPLPPALAPTLFSRFGDTALLLMLAGSLFGAAPLTKLYGRMGSLAQAVRLSLGGVAPGGAHP